MVNDLRKKLVRIWGISVLILLVLIYGCIYFLSVRQLNGAMDMLTDRISQNGGRFPEYREEEKTDQDMALGGFINEETRFSIRFFIVSFDEEGTVIGQNTQATSSVTDKAAETYGREAAEHGRLRGWLEDYRYKRYSTKQGYDIVFVDGKMNRSVFRMTMLSAGAALAGSGVILFLLMVAFARRAAKPAAESYEKQKQFITDANHELKTPLTLMMTNIDIVQSEIGNNEWLQDAKSEGMRMNELINRLGVLTKMDEGSSPAEKERFDLSQITEEKIKQFAALAESKKIKLNPCIDQRVMCCGSKKNMENLMDILLDNAVKYCDDEGVIAVSLHGRRRPVLIVENTYKDAPKLETEKLFDRFYRADKSRSPSGSFGIGLSIAKSIVDDQGGKITAYKKDGGTVGFKTVFR